MPEWVDNLVEDIEDRVATVAKFKTHKSRKTFFGDLANLINQAIIKNTNDTKNTAKVDARVGIVHPKPDGKPGVGHSVMTEGMASRADEIRERGSSNPYIQPRG